ncbi:DUF3515 family protein [Glaciibacter superstes]|uniref:DUF3515 family protein n=1 Tax=Glaciibacter superstes TaxID=501023 RepID=UPI0003B7053C|nr:DUF3515 family protein [Glaciibacter superstes]
MTPPFRRPRPFVLIALACSSLFLAGCAAAVPLQPAAEATDPACADVIVHLPESVGDQPERETNAQATGAWGEPAAILLHCGVEVPGPTTLPCKSVNGIDWIEDDADAPRYRYTTYGRTPAIEVVLDSDVVSGATVLTDLANAVEYVPATGGCLGPQDIDIPLPPE